MTAGCRNILILSVSAGEGHMRAAGALKAALLTVQPGSEVIILDTFRHTSPFLEKIILGAYMEMLKRTPYLYGYLYTQSEKGRTLSGFAKEEFNRLLSRFSAARLLEYIKKQRPDVVVCTHPFPLGVISTVKKSGAISCFSVGAITDLTIHPYWVFPETDLYFVGAEKLAGDLAGFGIPTERIHATGIPIDPSFGSVADRNSVLEGYGLDGSLATILVMGGGLGMGPLAESVKALGNLESSCQIIVVAGKNVQLKENVDSIAPGLKNTVRALGFVNNVHQLMASSDLMVSKAGGLSCSEALACGLPLFLLDPLPGQEERNSSFLEAEGAAVAVSGVGDLAEKISACLARPHRLKEMSGEAARLGRPDSAFLAAGLINSLFQSAVPELG
ncbi:MAG: glycosyltransferase [Actinobacteria bacterium]|nr:glycosyltransferase [Actinomycetota bacterium]